MGWTACGVMGGGPAGMGLALLLARSGVEVTVLALNRWLVWRRWCVTGSP
ncbi:FAD-dependent monooxygenase [Streptomyces sp. NPDC093064]